MCTWGSRKLTG